MKSKELTEILNQTRRTLDISLTAEQVEELINDLEILEILKKAFKSNSIYIITLKNSLESERINEKEYNKIKQWLEGE